MTHLPQFTAWQKGLLAAFAVVLVLAVVALAFVAGRSSAGPEYPASTSADAGFSRDMRVHHAQAVEMAMLVRDRSDREDIRSLAYDIALTQQHQIGQMHAWLQQWGLPHSVSGPRMAWMHDDGGHHGGSASAPSSGHGTSGDGVASGDLMPGMATAQQMRSLAGSGGSEADRLFLTLMIDHHHAGVDMAQAAVDRAGTRQVRLLAEGMVAAQSSEIAVLETMLADVP
jgi:uncharacterized protein (DUF305 family)